MADIKGILLRDMNYILGLDIGITSVGWCVINLDKDRIEDLGVRIFTAAEHPKNGASLALPRRLARGRRRLLRRKAYRVDRVRKLIVNEGILTQRELDNLFTDKDVISVWDARVEGLDRVLSNKEFSKLLINFAKRRGFKSNRKKEANDKELGVVISSINQNKEKMKETNSRTIGEYIYNLVKKSDDISKSLRNKSGDYSNCVSRDLIREEVDLIFDKQRLLGSKFASDEIEDKYLAIFESQRPYSDFEKLEKFVGYCTFEKSEKRAPKNSISFEEFVLYDNINKLSISCNGEKRRLNQEERSLIINRAFERKEIKYKDLRKLLNLSDEERFSTLTYSIDKDFEKTENTKFVSMKGYHEIKKAVEHGVSKEYWNSIKEDRKLLNIIAYVLTLGKTDEEIEKELLKRDVSSEVIEVVQDISFSQFGNLSVVAIDKILPFMKEGDQYNDACAKAGYDFKAMYKGEKLKKLPVIEIDEITNPVVKRSLAQTRKVINAVIDKYGQPTKINIELARELAKNFKDRKKIEKEQKENRDNKDKFRDKIKELFGKEPTAIELLKYRMWEEQKGQCAYSQRMISVNEIMGSGICEIDHIIPHSRSFDDGLANKVLVLCSENQNKANRTPYEYFGENEERWHRFEVWVKGLKLSYKKKQNLLKKNISKEEKEEMKMRNLQDTKYICKYIASYINNRLEFKESDSKQKVITVNGRATAYLRTRWGLNKVREDGDKHHALDAAVVAATTQGMVQRISKYSKANELSYVRAADGFVDIETGEILNDLSEYREIEKDILPRPWRGFSEELKMRLLDNPYEEFIKSPFKSYDEEFIKKNLKSIFVSRVPDRKAKGQLFGETVYSKKAFKEEKFIKKVKLVDLKEKDLDNIYKRETDIKLYNLIEEKMKLEKYDAKKAFSEELRKPTKDPNRVGPVVKSIKIETSVPFKNGVEINDGKGLVAKDGIVRIDIYFKEEKYYVVPVYRYQIVNDNVPKKAVVAHKKEEEWIDMDSSYKKKFSIYKNDLIKINYKNGKSILGYFNKFDRGSAVLEVRNHDNSEYYRGIGVKIGVKEFKKYEVDVLGNYYKVKEGDE